MKSAGYDEDIMKKSLTADRRNKIARILMKEGSIKVGDLSKRFGVSTETIRKDIIYLDEEGIAEKSFGGAVAKSDLVEQTIDAKEATHSGEKSDLAVKAASLVKPRSAVILDTGSTTKAIAKQLVLREGLTIFTNSLSIALLMAESDNDVYMIGGKIRKSSKAAIGGWADQALDSIHADIAFLGSDGFYGLAGPSTLSYSEAEFKKRVAEAADKVYTAADKSKFQDAGLFAYADWNEITGLITNEDAPRQMVDEIRKSTEVILAEKRGCCIK